VHQDLVPGVAAGAGRARQADRGLFSSDQYLAITATGALPQSNLQFKPVRKT